MGESWKREGIFMPLQLIQEFLLRCDVKTVLVSKSVSRDFNDLTARPGFVQEHYKHSRKRLLVYLSLSEPYIMDGREARFALYVDEIFERFAVPPQLQFPIEVYGCDREWSIFKVVNGVFCLFRERESVEQIVLVNPAMRQFKVMPRLICPFPSRRADWACTVKLAAFGLNPETGHFKLVLIEYLSKLNDTSQKCRVYVCSTTDVSWHLVPYKDTLLSEAKEIKHIKSDAYLAGVYYWIYKSPTSDVVQVAAFDMKTDELTIIDVAECYKVAGKRLRLSLCGEDDELALLIVDRGERSIEIWTMTNERSWSRRVTLGPIQDIDDVLFFWSKNQLLIQTGIVDEVMTNPGKRFPTELVLDVCLYDVATQSISKLITAHEQCVFTPEERIWNDRTRFHGYKESLVNLPGAEIWIPSSDRCTQLFTGRRARRNRRV